MSKLREAWWAHLIERSELFEPTVTENLEKAELMKIRHILEINTGWASDHKILIIQQILDAQDFDNPFIVYSPEMYGYVFNEEVDFWKYIKRAKRYR